VVKDGIATQEGLVLQHVRSGQQIFVVHGHQADFMSDRLCVMGRLLVRHVWKRLQLLGFAGTVSQEGDTPRRRKVERRIVEWVQGNQQITVCGHTHHPVFARNGAPYFNTGSCVYPGYITGLEFQNGQLMSVRWSARNGTRERETHHIERELTAPPMNLRWFRY
jgi:hypothetical protein